MNVQHCRRKAKAGLVLSCELCRLTGKGNQSELPDSVGIHLVIANEMRIVVQFKYGLLIVLL